MWPWGAECPGGHREPRGHPRGRWRAQGGQKSAKKLGLRRPVRSGRLRVARARYSVCGAVLDTQGRYCVKSGVSGRHSIIYQVIFLVKREQKTF